MGLIATLGTLIGVVMGLTGAGGGILAVPALVLGFGLAVQQAAPVAMVAVAVAAVVGTAEGLRRGVVRWRAALWMAMLGVPMTWVGAWLALRTPQRVLMALFAVIMLWSAWKAFAQVRRIQQGTADDDATEALWPSVGTLSPETGRFVWTLPTCAALGSVGAMVGFATGLLGVGGGFLMVPLLRKFTHLSLQNVAGTSLMVQSMVASGGVLSTTSQGAVLPMPLTAGFAAAMVLGMVGGRWLSARVPTLAARATFAALLLVVGLLFAWRAAGA